MPQAQTIEADIGRRLFNAMQLAGPHEDTTGPLNNPIRRTRAHANTGSTLHALLKGRQWLEDGKVLVCHGASVTDQFRITKYLGEYTVTHIAVR